MMRWWPRAFATVRRRVFNSVIRMRTMYDSMLRVGVPDVNMRVCTVPLRPPLALRENIRFCFCSHV